MSQTYVGTDSYGNEVWEDSGTTSTGDGGFDWSMVFNNAGGIFAGAGTLINSLNGKPSVTVQQIGTPGTNTGNTVFTSGMSNILWLVVGLVVVLVLIMMFKK